MKAARIHRFGPPDVVLVEEVPRPVPSAGELLVKAVAAGVGPWDAIIREGKSEVSPKPPLTLGSDLSGTVEELGPGVSDFQKGDEVYGVTNPQFCGANAEYAIASAEMMAHKPKRLSYVEAASAPVVAVTAWQMLYDYGAAKQNQTVLILGSCGERGSLRGSTCRTSWLKGGGCCQVGRHQLCPISRRRGSCGPSSPTGRGCHYFCRSGARSAEPSSSRRC